MGGSSATSVRFAWVPPSSNASFTHPVPPSLSAAFSPRLPSPIGCDVVRSVLRSWTPCHALSVAELTQRTVFCRLPLVGSRRSRQSAVGSRQSAVGTGRRERETPQRRSVTLGGRGGTDGQSDPGPDRRYQTGVSAAGAGRRATRPVTEMVVGRGPPPRLVGSGEWPGDRMEPAQPGMFRTGRLTTLPERMHEVQALSRRGEPSTRARTRLDVRIPAALGPPVGVTDVHPERRLLAADLTHRCHDTPTSS